MEKISTLKQMVDRSASLFGDSVAMQIRRDGAYRTWTFNEVSQSVRNLASHLASLGISPGDRVAILSENRPEWAISYLAVAYIGAVAVPLDALLSSRDHANLLKDSASKGVILSARFLSGLREFRGELQDLKFTVCMDPSDDALSFEKMAGEARGEVPQAKLCSGDLAAILYTSGTTGASKGVMLSHGNIVSNVLALAELFPMIGREDNFLSVLPLHHTFETTTGFLCPFYMGSRITYAESLKSHVLISNMQDSGVTIMLGVPLLFRLFYDGIKRGVEEKGLFARVLFNVLLFVSGFVRKITGLNAGRALFPMVHDKLGGNVRFWVSGAAAIDPEVISGFDLMGITILQGYGLTESSPVLTCCTLKNNRTGSVGKPLPGVEVRIDHPDDSGEGEILAKGPNIMKGYYNRPDVTERTIRDGWLCTGDIGRFDADGYLFITGRSKDVIVTGSGLNVYPEELEMELSKSDLISECCVLGRKVKEGMRKGMEEIVAVVIPDAEKASGEDAEKALRGEISRVNAGLPEYKRISDIIVMKGEFPKTSTRKVKRYVLRKELGL